MELDSARGVALRDRVCCLRRSTSAWQDITSRFLDIRRRIVEFPELGTMIRKLICIPTTSGTGSESTPFAVITDSETHIKYPIASYKLTPDVRMRARTCNADHEVDINIGPWGR